VSQPFLFAASGIALVVIGLAGVAAHRGLLRRTIALNFASSGVFLVLVGLARRADPPDPVPHALVLTGVVVSVSATALLLALAVRLHGETGADRPPEDEA
jgi:multicomponent Na+:H+ antiporter subunit C